MRMNDYLQTVVPDCSEQLDARPTSVIEEEGDFVQLVYETGEINRILTLSASPTFFVRLMWENIPVEDVNNIISFYFDVDKGFGTARTFKWRHPITGVTYVVRFTEPLNITRDAKTAGDVGSIQEIKLEVIGLAS